MELVFFTRLICTEFKSSTYDPVSPGSPAAVLLPETILSEGDKAWEAILATTALFRQDEALSRYIKGLYTTATVLSDRIWAHPAPPAANGPAVRSITDALQTALHHILALLETYFEDQLDAKTRISRYLHAALIAELRKLQASIGKLIKREPASAALPGLIGTAIRQVLEMKPGQAVSRRANHNWKTLCAEILPMLRPCEPGQREEVLTTILFESNFNMPQVAEYFIDMLRNRADAADNISERRTILYRLLEEYQTCRQVHSPSFFLHSPSLRESMILWIETEIQLCENRVANPLPISSAPDMEASRMQFGISVAQTACLLRLMQQCGVLTNKNQSALLRFVALHSSSLRGEVISADSLRVKFYNIERSTVDAVRGLLLEMVNQSRKGLPW